MIIFLIIAIVLNIGLAWFDSRKINNGLIINHKANAIEYVLYCALVYIAYSNVYFTMTLLFTRVIVFNIALNLFRGLRWSYMPLKPASFIDKLNQKIFKQNGIVMYFTYLVILILFIVKTF
jgi:hypothetical protein